MTEKRLRQIAYKQGFDRSTMGGNNVHPMVLELLKAAVNEAIQECADSLTAIGSVDQNQDLFFKHHKDANKKRILKLKVK